MITILVHIQPLGGNINTIVFHTTIGGKYDYHCFPYNHWGEIWLPYLFTYNHWGEISIP